MLKLLEDHWQDIRAEAFKLAEAGEIKKSDKYNDAGFNSFFKTGWTRFHLKWYGDAHPSARQLCPVTTELLQRIEAAVAVSVELLHIREGVWAGLAAVEERDLMAAGLGGVARAVTTGTGHGA